MSHIPDLNRTKLQFLHFIRAKFFAIHGVLFLACLGYSFLSALANITVPVLQEFSAGFLVLWMPGFCVVFLLWTPRDFPPIYRLPLLFLFSQAIIITGGLLCSIFGIPWTDLSVLCFIGGFVGLCYGIAIKKCHFSLNTPLFNEYFQDFDAFRDAAHKGEIIPRNFGVLFIFLVLLGVFSAIAAPIVKVDAWYHAQILNAILNAGQIQYNAFHGALGLHIFSGAFGLLGNLTSLAIARWFPIYLVINGGLAVFLLSHRLLKDPQMAVFCTYIVSSFIALGINISFLHGVNQFWSNALMIPFALYVIFFLFDANLSDHRSAPRKKWSIFLGFYLPIIGYFIHDSLFVIFWLSALFTQVFYAKTKRSQRVNLAIILLASVTFLISNFFVTESHLLLDPAVLFRLPWWAWVVLAGAAFPAWKFLRQMTAFPPGSYEAVASGNAPDAYIVRFLEKNLKYLLLLLGASASLLSLSIALPLNLMPTIEYVIASFYIAIDCATLLITAVALTILRRKDKCGRIFFYWGLFFIVATLGYAAYEQIFTGGSLSLRVYMAGTPVFGMLVTWYIFRKFKDPSMNFPRLAKTIGLCSIIFLSFALLGEMQNHQNVTPYEASSAQALSAGAPPGSLVMAQNKWYFAFTYYSDRSLAVNDWCGCALLHANTTASRDLFYSLHSQLAPGSELFVLLESNYLSSGVDDVDCENFGKMTTDQVNAYQNLSYFHHVFSSCAGNDKWVIILNLV